MLHQIPQMEMNQPRSSFSDLYISKMVFPLFPADVESAENGIIRVFNRVMSFRDSTRFTDFRDDHSPRRQTSGKRVNSKLQQPLRPPISPRFFLTERSNMMNGTLTSANRSVHRHHDLSHASTKTTTSTEYVGFANFPNQVFRRSIKNGFDFTLMVVGETGLGKSTFINTLFLTEVYGNPSASERVHIPSTVKVDSKTVCLVENDVKLNLTFVDTPGFGDAVDNSKCWEPIIKFVDDRFTEYLTEETKIERKQKIPDRRVHLCLYFIAPTGHGLKELDIQFMKHLHGRVNIVPVIAKADALTTCELTRFKKNITEDIEKNDIKIYKFPEPEEGTSEAEISKNIAMRSRLPFAIVGSNNIVETDSGRKLRVREYPWGVVEVENMDHNDFIGLRDMIIRKNLVDLIEVTRNVHYENFRFCHMSTLKGSTDRDPFTQMEHEQHQWEKDFELQCKEKERVFDEKVAIRERKLADLNSQYEEVDKENKARLEEKRRQLDQLMNEVTELRRTFGVDSSNGSSPLEKTKKKSGTLGIFNRN
uniref:Septin-type G domain-containing protein n=1 Tax=Steinernema glaseri TaxID=37863 RepID=A0A1I7ZSU8_9BILA